MLHYSPTVPETGLGSVEAYGDRVIVRRIPPDEKVGSIFIPEDAAVVGQLAYKTRLCEVVSVGHKRLKNGTTIPLSVSPGDRILMSIYKGKEFPVVGEELVAISEDDILCVLESEATGPHRATMPTWEFYETEDGEVAGRHIPSRLITEEN